MRTFFKYFLMFPCVQSHHDKMMYFHTKFRGVSSSLWFTNVSQVMFSHTFLNTTSSALNCCICHVNKIAFILGKMPHCLLYGDEVWGHFIRSITICVTASLSGKSRSQYSVQENLLVYNACLYLTVTFAPVSQVTQVLGRAAAMPVWREEESGSQIPQTARQLILGE